MSQIKTTEKQSLQESSKNKDKRISNFLKHRVHERQYMPAVSTTKIIKQAKQTELPDSKENDQTKWSN